MPRTNQHKASAALALPGLFLILGVMYATWAARIPALCDIYALTPAMLGGVLLGGGIGSVASFPLAAWLVGRYGARHAAWASGLAMLLVQPLLPLLPGAVLLTIGVVLRSSASSCFNVAINALGAEAEREAGKSIMSGLHAWFCLGAFIGALGGSAAAGIDLSIETHFLISSLLLLAALHMAIRHTPSDAPDPNIARKRFELPHGSLVWLGALVLLGSITEGSSSSWIALYLRNHLHASAGIAPLGYATYAGAMLASRLLGDYLKERYGARRVLSAGNFMACCGFMVAVFAPNITVAILGFTAVGLGIAMLFPYVFSAAGREGATSLAAVATMGYGGSLLGPPLMGNLVQRFGLPGGMQFLALITFTVACMAMATPKLEAHAAKV